jgi:hypothetical protein
MYPHYAPDTRTRRVLAVRVSVTLASGVFVSISTVEIFGRSYSLRQQRKLAESQAASHQQ